MSMEKTNYLHELNTIIMFLLLSSPYPEILPQPGFRVLFFLDRRAQIIYC